MNKIDIDFAKVKKLDETDICQGANKDLNSKDILEWIDYFFKSEDERKAVQRALAREIGILSHGLIKWNDSTSRRKVAETFNKVVKELK